MTDSVAALKAAFGKEAIDKYLATARDPGFSLYRASEVGKVVESNEAASRDAAPELSDTAKQQHKI